MASRETFHVVPGVLVLLVLTWQTFPEAGIDHIKCMCGIATMGGL